MGILGAFVWLFGFQLLGEATVRALGLPLPGPVAGMAMLVTVLALRGGVPDALRATGTALLRHFTLLLVPATAGLMLYLDRVRAEWLPIMLAGVGGAAVSMAVTALTLRLLLARTRR